MGWGIGIKCPIALHACMHACMQMVNACFVGSGDGAQLTYPVLTSVRGEKTKQTFEHTVSPSLQIHKNNNDKNIPCK